MGLTTATWAVGARWGSGRGYIYGTEPARGSTGRLSPCIGRLERDRKFLAAAKMWTFSRHSAGY